MRKFFVLLPLFFSRLAFAQAQDVAVLQASLPLDSVITASVVVNNIPPSFSFFNFTALQQAGKPAKTTLGFSKKARPVDCYYFPGRSNKTALVIAGVHGSELSAIEVANEVIRQLQAGEKPYYSVVVVPTLFPDNAATAEDCPCDRHLTNTGRYTFDGAIDPNRQLPALGLPFFPTQAIDAYGREMEKENALLLQLIQALSPSRIINLHAIKDYAKAGIYADPRTDCRGRALGYSSDSLLALQMAAYVADRGGNVPGNKLRSAPNTIYYLDPKAAPAGSLQPRNLVGMNSDGKISGVSLGSWASTAVCDEVNGYSRPAIRLLTIEFPGYKKPTEYQTPIEQSWFTQQVLLYAGAIQTYFLQDVFVEDEVVTPAILARN